MKRRKVNEGKGKGKRGKITMSPSVINLSLGAPA